MNRARGLSLLELLMVLVLVATLAGIGATVIGRQLPGRELHDAARTVAGELRFARARAIATGRPQVFVIDVNTRSWQGADERCVDAAIGRDPATLRRSNLMFDPTARSSGGMIKYYESEETCRQMVEQVIALGISEVAFYYPMLEKQVPMFERIARNLLPALKAAHK